MEAQTEPKRLSRVGKRAVAVPKGVTLTISGQTVSAQGPKGKLALDLPANVTAKKDGEAVTITSSAEGRDGARLQGLGRALVASMIKGASTGYETILELVGTGYRAEIKGPILNLALGFSHPVNFPIPKGVTVQIPGDSKGTLIILTGPDKEVMGQTAAKIRGFRPPEPYGGKGVRYQGEKVREKAGKAAKGGK